MKKEGPKGSTPLTEGVDFYFEKGLYVFTAEFLRKRGYCCKRGCRHCPYGFWKSETQGPDLKTNSPES